MSIHIEIRPMWQDTTPVYLYVYISYICMSIYIVCLYVYIYRNVSRLGVMLCTETRDMWMSARHQVAMTHSHVNESWPSNPHVEIHVRHTSFTGATCLFFGNTCATCDMSVLHVFPCKTCVFPVTCRRHVAPVKEACRTCISMHLCGCVCVNRHVAVTWKYM